jgi:hypothetical protein
VVAQVAAEEGECVRGRGGADEAREVSDGVAGRVQEVEGAVGKEVVRGEGADLKGKGGWVCEFTEGVVSAWGSWLGCLESKV